MTHWLTVAEAAEYIRAGSGAKIRAAIKAGDLKAYPYGKADIRLDAADVDAWLKSRAYEPPKRVTA
jgi:excisionase family DNA binding protein